jgi:zinc/manganese transport system permease protein
LDGALGVYLVFASLIIPALFSRQVKTNRRLLNAFGIGLLGYVAGLSTSLIFDLPSGPCVVWGLLMIGILTTVLMLMLGRKTV